jgi:hypothetical protein
VARLVSSVAIVSAVWFTSTSWRRDQIVEPYTWRNGPIGYVMEDWNPDREPEFRELVRRIFEQGRDEQ